MTRTTVRLNINQRLQIVKLLDQTCEKMGDGLIKWKGDWSDHKVASALGEPFNVNHVSYLRTQVYGSQFKSPKGLPKPHQFDSNLNARVLAIEEYLTSKNPVWKAMGV